MPLTTGQRDGITNTLDGVENAPPSVNHYVNDVLHERENLLALLRINDAVQEAPQSVQDAWDEVTGFIIQSAKTKAKAAADGLSVLLT